MQSLEIILLIVFSLLFLVGVVLFLIQKIKSKPKNSKKKKNVQKQETPSKEEKKSKHLRPVLLTAKPVSKQEKQEEKLDSSARNAENTEDISIGSTTGGEDLIDINELKDFVGNTSSRNTSNPSQNDFDKIKIFDDEPVEFVDDILPDDMPQYSQPNFNRQSRTGQSDFLNNRDSKEKRLYDELKNMSPEMKKIIIADILKRKDDN